jgi:hypothetical protein
LLWIFFCAMVWVSRLVCTLQRNWKCANIDGKVFGLFIRVSTLITVFILRNISTTTGKIKRAVMQFTPASWTHVTWIGPNSGFARTILVLAIVMVWQVCEFQIDIVFISFC